jgi:alkyldihydroxyacetonephosphate synthase
VQARPRWRASASFLFREWSAAVEATRAIAQSGLHPANCRLLDAREALMNRVPADGGHVLIVGFESADHPLDAWIDRARAIAEGHGATCPKGVVKREASTGAAADAAASWKGAFLDAPYLQTILVSLGLVADTFETACTWDRFADLQREVNGSVAEALGGGSISCRFTHVYPDGPAPYFTFVAAPGGRDVLEVWAAAKRAAMGAIGRCGGTITHHHAVGRTHRPGYDRERPDLFARALAAAKRELDPRGILNPGVLI